MPRTARLVAPGHPITSPIAAATGNPYSSVTRIIATISAFCTRRRSVTASPFGHIA